ncbi:unnamed protein product, partial [Choristocarpus tenellus]
QKNAQRWLHWTRTGADFLCRRFASMVRQSLTVVLCLADEDIQVLEPALPMLSTCPAVRFDTWSNESLYRAASRILSLPL